MYNFFIQVHINDIKHLIQTIASGKAPSIATSWWPSEATRRLVVICLSTLGLLFARLHIMGSQLPVFTRYVHPFEFSTPISGDGGWGVGGGGMRSMKREYIFSLRRHAQGHPVCLAFLFFFFLKRREKKRKCLR